MKSKLLIVSILLFGICAGKVSAQETDNYYTPKWSNNIFLSIGGGIHSINDDGFGEVAPHFNISLGKLITPTWGIRAQLNGPTQHLCIQDYEVDYKHKKNYFGVNVDAMLNLSTLFAGANPNRVFEVFGFAGPMMSVAKSPDHVSINESEMTMTTEGKSMRARFGASAGVGLKFNIKRFWAIDIEARGAVTPSIYGNISNHRKAEGTGMLTAGVTYIFGGKKFAKVQTQVVEVEKEVVKEVVRELPPKEVVKEVVKEVPVQGVASIAIFFKINKAEINDEGMVNVKLMAKTMKANPQTKYQIAGYADKATGTPEINQTLSEKRAQAVYDALIAEGVDESQLEKVAMGGTDPMFVKDRLNRVVILEIK